MQDCPDTSVDLKQSGNGKQLEFRAFPSRDIHAKVFIGRFNPEDRDFGFVITGSSNFSYSDLVANREFNVELSQRRDVESLGQAEDHLLVTAVTDDGTLLDEEQANRLLTVSARVVDQSASPVQSSFIESVIEERREFILRQVSERNANFFEAEANKIDGWADDLKVGLEREIKEFDRQIKGARRSAVSALTLEEKLEVQKQIRHLEGQRNTKRRALFEAQDEIDAKRELLITEIEGKLQRKESIRTLFSILWRVV